ncbi:hypothetical protein NL676_009580 [Syzygium grande]|nr:hypothetical protein NL676_009580 [Syzygium grande]
METFFNIKGNMLFVMLSSTNLARQVSRLVRAVLSQSACRPECTGDRWSGSSDGPCAHKDGGSQPMRPSRVHCGTWSLASTCGLGRAVLSRG